MWTAILAASAAIVGSVTAGLFNLAIQRGARTVDNDRWAHDSEQRRRDRLYDQRLRSYTVFLDESSNALGYESFKVLAKYRQAKSNAEQPLTTSSSYIEILARSDAPDAAGFNESAVMRMSRARRAVDMLTESADVKEAAEKMTVLLREMIALNSGDPEINEKFFAIYSKHGEASDTFVRAAHVELAS